MTKTYLVGKFTREELREALQYFPSTGRWVWKWMYNRKDMNGTETGKPNKRGHSLVTFRGQQFQSSRLIWFYMTGEWPVLDVDHKNGKHSDNRWKNLRQATLSQNRGNSKISYRCKSGYKGVHRMRNRFVAVCARRYLGTFDTAREAHKAYLMEARLRYGEFARAA